MREKAVIILFDCANMFTCTWIKLPVCCGLIFPFLLSLSHKRVYTKQSKTTLKKKNKLEKLYFVLTGKVPKYGQNFKQYTIYTCNSLEEFSTLE